VGIKTDKENNLNFILAVGAGSTIDCSKLIATGVFYSSDPWHLILDYLFYSSMSLNNTT
jgi:butanol dehydrogenase